MGWQSREGEVYSGSLMVNRAHGKAALETSNPCTRDNTSCAKKGGRKYKNKGSNTINQPQGATEENGLSSKQE